jgi:trimeric autotransporter adhesin
MLDVRRRPEGRLFYWLLSGLLVLLVWSGVSVPAAMAAPATTRVSDIVYRADGSVASGVVLISWPAFTAADGTPVAAGSTSVALGNDGSLNVDLVPNAGAAPSGIYYSAVFQLDDVVRTEYWVVGTTSPATLAAVRATPGSGVAAPAVSKQYVDSAIAANKAYVDQQVSTVGSGSYVSKNGDAMTGPLTLPSDPTGTSPASTKHRECHAESTESRAGD